MFRLLHYILGALLLFLPLGTRAQSADHDFELSRQMDVFNNIVSLIDLHYVDTLPAKTCVESGISHMLSTLDPYTVYYPEERHDELFQLATGRYAGIGITLYPVKSSRRCMITSVEHGGPAETAGLRPGDVIVGIDDKDVGQAASAETKDIMAYLTSIALLLRGEAGSTLEVEVARPGQTRTKIITVHRQLIEKKSVAYAAMVSDSIGYVCLSGFSENTEHELRQAVGTLLQRGAHKLILDLRNNPGGLIDAAIKSVALFVPKETEVLRTRGKDARKNEIYYTSTEPIDELMPLVVLVDNESASAAEITAGALQDYDRAVILGRRTFGKGLVQSTYDLPFGGLIKLTSAKYYIPSGRCIQALDYSHRTASGDPTPLPDSLTHAFQTSAGRTVYDGGGIKPDVEVAADTLPEIVTRLMESDVLYEYVADYARHHRNIPSPLTFEITEADFVAFKTAVITSSFQFGNRSREALEKVRSIARAEGYGEQIDAELAEIARQLSPDLDNLLERWRRPVKKLLEQMIVQTVYGEAGLAEYNLRGDHDLSAAIALLRDDRRYRSILTTAPER